MKVAGCGLTQQQQPNTDFPQILLRLLLLSTLSFSLTQSLCLPVCVILVSTYVYMLAFLLSLCRRASQWSLGVLFFLHHYQHTIPLHPLLPLKIDFLLVPSISPFFPQSVSFFLLLTHLKKKTFFFWFLHKNPLSSLYVIVQNFCLNCLHDITSKHINAPHIKTKWIRFSKSIISLSNACTHILQNSYHNDQDQDNQKDDDGPPCCPHSLFIFTLFLLFHCNKWDHSILIHLYYLLYMYSFSF